MFKCILWQSGQCLHKKEYINRPIVPNQVKRPLITYFMNNIMIPKATYNDFPTEIPYFNFGAKS